MRIVLIGVSHWHTPFYLDPVLAMSDVAVVGVSDPDRSRAEEVAAKARCPAFDDYREMCARLKPDFAFALGRHCDMAEEARFLIGERFRSRWRSLAPSPPPMRMTSPPAPLQANLSPRCHS